MPALTASSGAVAQVLLHRLAHSGRRARHADLQRVGIGHRVGEVDLARQAALWRLVARDLEGEQAVLDRSVMVSMKFSGVVV